VAKGDAIPGGDAPPAPVEADARGADGVDALLERVAAPAPIAAARLPALAMARVVRVEREGALVAVRGRAEPVLASIGDDVDRELVERAAKVGDAVLVEVVEGEAPVVAGVVQRRIPPDIELRAATVTIEAEREVVLRAGRSALRIREDGDVELVGSRLLAMSRGLFRIVGRVLRLN
jgi:hypothetical protein